MWMRLRAALVVVAVTAILAGCGKKAKVASGPSPELTGLAAVPSTAEVIIGMDAARLAESQIITRAIELLISREPDLATKWKALRESCPLELKNVNRMMIALGPTPAGGRLGTGPLVMIATGKIAEADLVKCVREIVGKGGGSLVSKNHQGRTFYQVKDGARTVFIAFGRPDTVILGNNEAYVHEAVGGGQKALDNRELAGWLKQADQDAPVWVVGRVADRLKAGLVRASNNTLKAGAKAYVGSLDLTSGVKGEMAVLMESAADAKQLESMLNLNLVGLSWAAQVAALAKIVQKVSIKSSGSTVRLTVPLTMEDVNRVLSALDGDKAPAQDSPPAGGSASNPPAP
jgi:hypothetical protein